MNKNIKMITTNYIKEGKKWINPIEEISFINEENYNNIVESKKFFTNIGSYERHEKSYTSKGYIVTRINSISPNKSQKVTRKFIFN